MSEQNKDQPTAAPLPSASIPLLPLVFLGSGCAALIYEVVWLQLLQLVIGLTTVSLGLLLGVFMGGLCLGSVLLPRCVGLGHHPLRVFAMIEAGIGLLGVAVLFGLPLLDRLYTVNASSALTGIILRASIAVLCLLPPTLLMGATLPAISRWVEATREGVSWM